MNTNSLFDLDMLAPSRSSAHDSNWMDWKSAVAAMESIAATNNARMAEFEKRNNDAEVRNQEFHSKMMSVLEQMLSSRKSSASPAPSKSAFKEQDEIFKAKTAAAAAEKAAVDKLAQEKKEEVEKKAAADKAAEKAAAEKKALAEKKRKDAVEKIRAELAAAEAAMEISGDEVDVVAAPAPAAAAAKSKVQGVKRSKDDAQLSESGSNKKSKKPKKTDAERTPEEIESLAKRREADRRRKEAKKAEEANGGAKSSKKVPASKPKKSHNSSSDSDSDGELPKILAQPIVSTDDSSDSGSESSVNDS